jgi:plasmid maintenance system antidote protein VapI
LGVDPLKKIESHPLGDLITQFLSRRRNLSQNKLAEDTDVHPTIVSRMCHGQRLTGPKARGRILKFIRWFYNQEVLKSLEEANELLAASGQPGLNATVPREAHLIQLLEPPVGAQQTDASHDTSTADSPSPSRRIRFVTRRDILMGLVGAALTYLFGPVYGLLKLLASPQSGKQSSGIFPPQNQWLVLSEAQDDRNVIVVNQRIAGVAKDAQWISIDGYLRRDGKANEVALVNINGPGRANWRMFIGYNDTRWPEGGAETEHEQRKHGSFESQVFRIDLDPKAEEPVKKMPQKDRIDPQNRHDEAWKVRMTIVDDVGLVIVNGVVAAAAYVDYQFRPFDIGKWLYADRPNEVLIMIWNMKGEACGDISIWKGETACWLLSDEFEEDKTGEVYYRHLIIDEAGNVIDEDDPLSDTG